MPAFLRAARNSGFLFTSLLFWQERTNWNCNKFTAEQDEVIFMSKEKTKKFRGSRTCGGGTHKNRRGGGSRGGRGNAGTCKHHFVRSMQRGITFGKHGFKRPLSAVKDKVIVNVG